MKKLQLNKKTISALTHLEMTSIQGGNIPPPNTDVNCGNTRPPGYSVPCSAHTQCNQYTCGQECSVSCPNVCWGVYTGPGWSVNVCGELTAAGCTDPSGGGNASILWCE